MVHVIFSKYFFITRFSIFCQFAREAQFTYNLLIINIFIFKKGDLNKYFSLIIKWYSEVFNCLNQDLHDDRIFSRSLRG
jgi:hypothetical protein